MTEYKTAMGRDYKVEAQPRINDEYYKVYVQFGSFRACCIFMDKLRERDKEINRLQDQLLKAQLNAVRSGAKDWNRLVWNM